MDSYDIRQLPDEGATIEEPLTVEWLAAIFAELEKSGGLSWTAPSEGSVKLRLMKVDPDAPGSPVVRIDGTATAAVETDCVRCLELVKDTIDAEVDATFFPRGEIAPGASDGDTEPVDPSVLDEWTYEGMEIDVPDMLREMILLDLNMHPTCKDEAGCDTRTQALLESVNPVIEEPEIDPRWEALKKIQLKSD